MKRLLVIALPLAVISGGVASFLARGSEVPPPFVGPSGGRYRGSEPPEDHKLPSFALREWNGARLSTRTLEGKVVLVTFLETKCNEACPIIADQIDMGLERLTETERRRVEAIAISVHPRDDTPASVRHFLRVHRVQGDLHYLIGRETELRPVWRAFYIASALDSGDADSHSASVRIFDAAGEWVSTLHPRVDLTPANLAHDVRVALRDS
jgi:protein SCO1/2